MAFSPVGRKKVTSHLILLFVNIIVLALSAQVNLFQGFFFIADLFPLVLSIITFVIILSLLALDFALDNSYTSRAQFEIGVFGVLSVFWLAFNAFSTSRWRQVPFHCNSIPSDFPDEITWCKNLQALKSFVWTNFLICLFIAILTLRYAVSQHGRGNKHIFKTPLSYHPNESQDFNRGSEFLQFEKMP
ncbi:hypothetical protein K443DRAFT_680329 [Laccaria amethystina LaAM-08-1]|uniref:MARVEL domain-containing protein n=1 Tax=Laccaria amethystina LaAM-08-1 TaxID=1095629 RepID=A0A0C9WNC6_9AGAR|nr:hypothetical protein K443DRAFT_680329 [Laccaria amethystina LaAM-08-1]